MVDFDLSKITGNEPPLDVTSERERMLVDAAQEALKILRHENGGTMLDCIAAAGAILEDALDAQEKTRS